MKSIALRALFLAAAIVVVLALVLNINLPTDDIDYTTSYWAFLKNGTKVGQYRNKEGSICKVEIIYPSGVIKTIRIKMPIIPSTWRQSTPGIDVPVHKDFDELRVQTDLTPHGKTYISLPRIEIPSDDGDK